MHYLAYLYISPSRSTLRTTMILRPAWLFNHSSNRIWISWTHPSLSVRYSHTVYPKKYAHGFVVLCFVVVMQSFIMNSHEVFIHIHQGCFAGTGAIVRLPQCQWSKPDGYGKISQCITTTKHSKAKTVCIFLGIYCIPIYRRICPMVEKLCCFEIDSRCKKQFEFQSVIYVRNSNNLQNMIPSVILHLVTFAIHHDNRWGIYNYSHFKPATQGLMIQDST